MRSTRWMPVENNPRSVMIKNVSRHRQMSLRNGSPIGPQLRQLFYSRDGFKGLRRYLGSGYVKHYMLLYQMNFYSFPFAAPTPTPPLKSSSRSSRAGLLLMSKCTAKRRLPCTPPASQITWSCVVALSQISRTSSMIRFQELEHFSGSGCCDQRVWSASISLMRSYQAEPNVSPVRRALSDLPVALF